MKGTNLCSSRPPVLTVLLRIAHSTFRPSLRDKISVCFNIVTSKSGLFQWFVTCMYGRTQSELYFQHQCVIHKEASGRHLLYPALILLVLFSTFLDQRQKQERPSFHALYLCVTYRCCFFHSKRQIKKRSPFWSSWSLEVVWVKLGLFL